MTTTQKKQANASPKYVIELSIAPGFYLNSKGDNVTGNENEAMQYSVGFDHEETKLSYWAAALNADVNVKYL